MSRSVPIVLMAMIFSGASMAQEAAAPDTTKKAATEGHEPQTMAKEEVVAPPALTLKQIVFCTSVEEREPVGVDSVFSTDVGTLYFWSNVLNDGEPSTVTHVWYLNGEEKARVELPVKYARNRVWSSKIVPPEWDGQWKVEVVSGDGDVLGARSCVVK